jgi:predicted TIM-barrel fold metal-dependent hydrolase
MPNRRDFLKNIAGASAGAFLFNRGLVAAAYPSAQEAASAKRRELTIGGKRIKTVDVHTHAFVPEVTDLVKGTDLEKPAAGIAGQLRGRDSTLGPERVAKMNADGIDVHAASINPFWYGADQDMAGKLIDLQNEKLAAMCAKNPDRFVAFATVALQFPDMAAEQLETGMKKWGLRGAAIGGNVNGEELSLPKFDPFWAKAQELQALIFMHPQGVGDPGLAKRLGMGDPAQIGNPLETSIFISHLIFDGTLDKFPNLKICCAHGGGFLPSYPNRMDNGCLRNPSTCRTKKPSEYLKQLYVDSLVFTAEGVRHLAAVCGPSQVMIGTDSPIAWVIGSPLDPILAVEGLSDADRAAMVGGTACKLLNIPTKV